MIQSYQQKKTKQAADLGGRASMIQMKAYCPGEENKDRCPMLTAALPQSRFLQRIQNTSFLLTFEV